MERFDYDGLLEVNSDLRKQLADAQAQIEALQRELRLSRFNQANAEAEYNGLQVQIRTLTQQLDAEREKVKGLEAKVELQEMAVRCAGHALDESRETHNQQAAKIREQQIQHTQLQALVLALPVVSNNIIASYMTDMQKYDAQDYAAFSALLEYRATLDPTTPTACSRIGGCLKEQGFHCCCEDGTCD